MGQKHRRSVLAQIDTKTKVLALVTLVLEATFLASIWALPSEQVFWALAVCASVFTVVAIGVIVLELADVRTSGHRRDLIPSPLTPDSPLLTKMITGAVQTVCRGVTVPKTPEEAQLRAFIFKRQGNALVCTHFWAPDNMKVKEEVGLTFPLNRDLENEVAVVKAYFEQGPTRMPAKPPPPGTEGVKGVVDDRLQFVLAMPIRNRKPSDGIWGVVDLDSTNATGAALLSSTVSDNVLFHLAEHLRVLFSLCETGQDADRYHHH